MSTLKIWLFIILAFLVVGIPLGLLIGGFGYVIGVLVALLVGIIIFKKRAEKENADQVVYDEDVNYVKRKSIDDEE